MLRNVSLTALAGLTIVLLGCSGGGNAGDNPADTLTWRQKDSIIATFPIPGARGVGKALDALEKSIVRAEEHDSLFVPR